MENERQNQETNRENEFLNGWEEVRAMADKMPASFSELKSQGKLPEGVRDEQDYQKYLAMQEAKQDEKVDERQVFYEKIAGIEDENERNLMTAMLGFMDMKEKREDKDASDTVARLVSGYVDREDKTLGWNEFWNSDRFEEKQKQGEWFGEGTVRFCESIAEGQEIARRFNESVIEDDLNYTNDRIEVMGERGGHPDEDLDDFKIEEYTGSELDRAIVV